MWCTDQARGYDASSWVCAARTTHKTKSGQFHPIWDSPLMVDHSARTVSACHGVISLPSLRVFCALPPALIATLQDPPILCLHRSYWYNSPSKGPFLPPSSLEDRMITPAEAYQQSNTAAICRGVRPLDSDSNITFQHTSIHSLPRSSISYLEARTNSPYSLYHRHRFIDNEDTRDGIDEIAQGLNLRYIARSYFAKPVPKVM